MVIRKKLKAASLRKLKDFHREGHFLSFLKCLEHLSILELLGSHTCNGAHSFVFPVASGDLERMLGSPKHFDFNFEADYLFALHELASTVDKLLAP